VKFPVAKSPLVTIAAFAAGTKAELAAMLAQKTLAMSRGSMAYPSLFERLQSNLSSFV
jgi:hypothetical protein